MPMRSGRFDAKAAQVADELAARPETYQSVGFVFTDSIGRPVKLDAPTKAFRDIAAAAKLPSAIILHSLRHSFASWSLANGGDIVAVQRVMGHSVPSTTLNLYSHVVAGGRERAVAAASETPRQVQAAGAVLQEISRAERPMRRPTATKLQPRGDSAHSRNRSARRKPP